MAQADQHTPIEWGDEDRWTLDEAFHYLTVTLGYTEKRALDELEQARLARRLVIQVHKIVEGKRQAGEYLPPEKSTNLFLIWGGFVPWPSNGAVIAALYTNNVYWSFGRATCLHLNNRRRTRPLPIHRPQRSADRRKRQSQTAALSPTGNLHPNRWPAMQRFEIC